MRLAVKSSLTGGSYQTATNDITRSAAGIERYDKAMADLGGYNITGVDDIGKFASKLYKMTPDQVLFEEAINNNVKIESSILGRDVSLSEWVSSNKENIKTIATYRSGEIRGKMKDKSTLLARSFGMGENARSIVERIITTGKVGAGDRGVLGKTSGFYSEYLSGVKDKDVRNRLLQGVQAAEGGVLSSEFEKVKSLLASVYEEKDPAKKTRMIEDAGYKDIKTAKDLSTKASNLANILNISNSQQSGMGVQQSAPQILNYWNNTWNI